MTLDSKARSKVLKYRWAIFGVLAFAYFFVYFHRVSTAVVSEDLQGTFGVGAASIALLSSAYFYAYTIMQLPSGLLTDSWGPRKTVSIFTMVAAAGAILTGIASSFLLVIAGRLLIGVGVAMVYIPIMKILATWYRKNEFASLSGILLAVGNIGALSAAGPLALMSGALGWQQVFLALGVITVVLAVAAWMITRDRPVDMGLPSIQEIESDETGEPIPPAKEVEKIPMTQALKMTFGSGMKFWPLAVWFFFMYGSIMVYQGLWAGPYYADVLGWDKATYGMVLTFIGIGMIVGCPLAGILSDKVLKSRRKVLIIGTVAYTIIWAAIWMSTGRLDSVIGQSALNFMFGFFGGFFVVSYAQIKELFPISIVGTTTAALNIFPFAGGAILQQVTGLMLVERTAAGYETIWLFMLVCMIIATVAGFLSKEKARVPATVPTAEKQQEMRG
ncbi:MAG TPA: MFS transporter [Methanomassiliicoccaceae archaeon]|nr:MFS transporter [Methanomassiliicoccaceae archaeon]HQD87535.1 MFS transporter [Methanomassiliicoccaceae archaeon]